MSEGILKDITKCRRFEVLGSIYNVDYDVPLLDYDGHCHSADGYIQIRKGMIDGAILRVLLHELIHILDNLNPLKDDGKLTEREIDRIVAALLMIKMIFEAESEK